MTEPPRSLTIDESVPRPLAVRESEYRRLLGYPAEAEPAERARELARSARDWYDEHGRPWIYLREVSLGFEAGALLLDGIRFRSRQLHAHLSRFEARRVLVLAVSAGAESEARAAELWEEGKPDEYFFQETYGSAVVEHLIVGLNARVCAEADADNLLAIPHYSPGYTGWDVAEQGALFELIRRGAPAGLPGPLEVLPSGMPRPKKSQLGVIGLAPRTARNLAAGARVPCEQCSFAPCRYRRRPFQVRARPAGATRTEPGEANGPGSADARYTVNRRALEKWAGERVHLAADGTGRIIATFRYDGTTCSNLGQPLAFHYRVDLDLGGAAPVIRAAECRPADGDEGHRSMCGYLSDGERLMKAIADEQPLVGRPLEDVFAWVREPAPAGCQCTPASRAHKWGLAYEAIHFALAQRRPSAAAAAGVSP